MDGTKRMEHSVSREASGGSTGTGAGSKAHTPLVPKGQRPRFQGFCLRKSSLVFRLQTPRTPWTLARPSGLCGLFPTAHVLVSKFTFSSRDHGNT